MMELEECKRELYKEIDQLRLKGAVFDIADINTVSINNLKPNPS